MDVEEERLQESLTSTESLEGVFSQSDGQPGIHIDSSRPDLTRERRQLELRFSTEEDLLVNPVSNAGGSPGASATIRRAHEVAQARGREHGAHLSGLNHDPETTSHHTPRADVHGQNNLLDQLVGNEDRTPVLGCRLNQAQWRSTNQIQMNEDRLVDMLSKAIEKVVQVAGRPQKEESTRVVAKEFEPNYAGSDYENPGKFLGEIQDICLREKIIEKNWTRYAVSRLTGEAEKWYEQYKYFEWSFQEFSRNLLNRFDNAYLRLNLQRDLFCRTQTDREEVVGFIARKMALYRRLNLGMDPRTLVPQVRVLLRPDIQLHLVGVRIASIEDLSTTAQEIETQLRFTQEDRGGMRPIPGQEVVPYGNRPRTTQFTCRWCGGGHMNRDCPRRALPGPNPNEGRRSAVESAERNQGNNNRGFPGGPPPENPRRSEN